MNSVLVTGGAGGIGSAICAAMAREGYNVAIHFRTRRTEAQELAKRLSEEYGVAAAAFYADLTREDEVAAMFDELEASFPALDALINNAGIAQQKLFTDITSDEWRQMLASNLDSVFYCSREALKRFMLPRHSGAIVNISSMWGQAGASCEVHYSAAKAGVIGMTKALAKEVGLSGIRVNCIAPGVIMTDMMKGFDEEALAELREETPLGKLGTPAEIAEAAAFLCSEKANFITGQILGVNGGFII